MGKLWKFLLRIGFVTGDCLYYIGGSDVLPPPLKGEDERTALEQ